MKTNEQIISDLRRTLKECDLKYVGYSKWNKAVDDFEKAVVDKARQSGKEEIRNNLKEFVIDGKKMSFEECIDKIELDANKKALAEIERLTKERDSAFQEGLKSKLTTLEHVGFKQDIEDLKQQLAEKDKELSESEDYEKQLEANLENKVKELADANAKVVHLESTLQFERSKSSEAVGKLKEFKKYLDKKEPFAYTLHNKFNEIFPKDAKKLVKAGVVVMPEMVYCNDGTPITEEQAFKMRGVKGCWHQKDRKCFCKCHAEPKKTSLPKEEK